MRKLCVLILCVCLCLPVAAQAFPFFKEWFQPAIVEQTIRPSRTSEQGIAFLKLVENFSPTAYPDAGGGYSIGYGFQTWQGRRVTLTYPGRITQAKADKELIRQLGTYESAVQDEFRGMHLPQHAFDALVSLCYNLGHISKTILNKAKAKQPITVRDFVKSATVDGQINMVLYNRRLREFTVFVGRYDVGMSLDTSSWPAAKFAFQMLLPYSLQIR